MLSSAHSFIPPVACPLQPHSLSFRPCIFPSTSRASLLLVAGSCLCLRSLLTQEPLFHSDVLTGTRPLCDFLWLRLFPSLAGRSVRPQALGDLLATPALVPASEQQIHVLTKHLELPSPPPGRAPSGGGAQVVTPIGSLFPSRSLASRVVT